MGPSTFEMILLAYGGVLLVMLILATRIFVSRWLHRRRLKRQRRAYERMYFQIAESQKDAMIEWLEAGRKMAEIQPESPPRQRHAPPDAITDETHIERERIWPGVKRVRPEDMVYSDVINPPVSDNQNRKSLDSIG